MIGGLTGAFANPTHRLKLPSVGGGHALMTGVSPGIGWARAEALVKVGFRVVGTSRRGAGAPHPEGVQMVMLGMSSAGDIAAVVAHESHDVVVTNAGESQSGVFGELPHEAPEHLFQVSVLGQVELLQQLLPGMHEAGRGRIVLVSSVLGGLSLSYRSPYVAMKVAVRGFGLSLRGEVVQFGIGMTVVEPGAINTGISSRRTTCSDEGSVYATDAHRMLTKLNANEGRGIPTSEIAEVVIHEVTTKRPLALVTRGSSANMAVPLMRRIPMQAMLSIMRRVHGLQWVNRRAIQR